MNFDQRGNIPRLQDWAEPFPVLSAVRDPNHPNEVAIVTGRGIREGPNDLLLQLFYRNGKEDVKLASYFESCRLL